MRSLCEALHVLVDLVIGGMEGNDKVQIEVVFIIDGISHVKWNYQNLGDLECLHAAHCELVDTSPCCSSQPHIGHGHLLVLLHMMNGLIACVNVTPGSPM